MATDSGPSWRHAAAISILLLSPVDVFGHESVRRNFASHVVADERKMPASPNLWRVASNLLSRAVAAVDLAFECRRRGLSAGARA